MRSAWSVRACVGIWGSMLKTDKRAIGIKIQSICFAEEGIKTMGQHLHVLRAEVWITSYISLLLVLFFPLRTFPIYYEFVCMVKRDWIRVGSGDRYWTTNSSILRANILQWIENCRGTSFSGLIFIQGFISQLDQFSHPSKVQEMFVLLFLTLELEYHSEWCTSKLLIQLNNNNFHGSQGANLAIISIHINLTNISD